MRGRPTADIARFAATALSPRLDPGARPLRSLYCPAPTAVTGGAGLRPGDRFKPIAADELYEMLAMGEPFCVVDVRTEGEYEQAHIPGSILMPLHELPARSSEIPNGGTPIAVVAEQGHRSLS